MDNQENNLESYIYETIVEEWIQFLKSNVKIYTWCAISEFVEWKTVSKYPDLPWDWLCELSKRIPDIETFKKYSNMKLDMYAVLTSKNLTWNDLKDMEEKYSYHISQNPNITWDIVQNNPDYPWDWRSLTYNPNITNEIILNNMDKDWEWIDVFERDGFPVELIPLDRIDPHYFGELSDTKTLTWDIVENNPNIQWVWISLSEHPNITWDIIKNNPDRPWDWNYVSLNPNITWEIIQNNPDYPWSYENLTYNPNITWEIVLNNLDKPWYIHGIMANKKYTLEIVKSYPNFNWNWYYISKHPYLTWEFVKEFEDIRFDWDELSIHKNITFDIIKENPEYPWNPSAVINNPNVDWETIQQNWIIKSSTKVDDETIQSNSGLLSSQKNSVSETIQDNPDYPWKNIPAYKDVPWSAITINKNPEQDYYYLSRNPFKLQRKMIREECIVKWRAASRIRKWWLFKCYLNPFHPVGQKRLTRSYQEMVNNDG